MEQQLKMQDHFSRYQLEQYEQPNLPLTNGYHEEYEGGKDICLLITSVIKSLNNIFFVQIKVFHKLIIL